MFEMLFQTIIEITLAVSVIIVLLLIFSKILDKNYTTKWRYWVWLVLAVRLLIPFNISLPNAPIQLSQFETTRTVDNINNHQSIQPVEQTKPIEEKLDTNIINENSSDKIFVNNHLALSQNEATQYKMTISRSFDTVKVLSIVWILGGILFLLYQLIVYFSYRRKIKLSSWDAVDKELLNIYQRVLEEIKVNRNIPIKICKVIKSPMVLGFWNPILLLPDIDFTKEHLQMILRHEVIHIKRRDILYKTVILFARAAHWFNPLVHIMSVEANKDIELSCDAAVVENQNVDYRKDYSEAILMSVYKGNRRKTVFSTYFGGGKKMLKKRFASLFDLRKKKKGIISLILVALLIGIMGLCISCSKTAVAGDDSKTRTEDSNKTGEENNGKTGVEGDQATIYENEALGFSLELPKEWKDRYVVEEWGNSVGFFSKKVYEQYNGMGLLFTIVRDVGELITEKDTQQAPQAQQILLQGNGYTYYMRLPSDVQYPMEEELSDDYIAMSKQISKVAKGIELLGNQKPQASNKGFKVVGSSFFTLEIPENWDIKQELLSDFTWYIYDETQKGEVGAITLVPYDFGDESEGEYTSSYSGAQVLLYDDETLRGASIFLNPEIVKQEIIDTIKNSFSFVNGPFNIFDLQTQGKQYLAQGGKKVFGRIEDFEMENGEPVTVKINVMEFIPDGIDDNNPNGFRIEDLDKIETYPLDIGAMVVPLVPPGNNSFKLYEMPLLDSDFIKKYDNYKYFYYDFIIGSDGKVKSVFGRYVP